MRFDVIAINNYLADLWQAFLNFWKKYFFSDGLTTEN